jgi:hypothetical protein
MKNRKTLVFIAIVVSLICLLIAIEFKGSSQEKQKPLEATHLVYSLRAQEGHIYQFKKDNDFNYYMDEGDVYMYGLSHIDSLEEVRDYANYYHLTFKVEGVGTLEDCKAIAGGLYMEYYTSEYKDKYSWPVPPGNSLN